MPTVLDRPRLTEERISTLIDETLRKQQIDPKKFRQELAESTAKVQLFRPNLEALEQFLELPSEIVPGPQPPALTSTFAKLAREALNLVRVIVHTPSAPATEHFNSGEMYPVMVEIRNTSELPIRDVLVSLQSIGPVTVVRSDGSATLSPQYVPEIKPMKVHMLQFFVLAQHVTDIVPARLQACLDAEVVPFVRHVPQMSQEFDIWPST